MRQTIKPIRRLKGDISVPGELEGAILALLLAAVSDGACAIANLPPGADAIVALIRSAGIKAVQENSTLEVAGGGPRALVAMGDLVDLSAAGDSALPAIAVLAGQGSRLSVRLGEAQRERGAQLLKLLARMGVVSAPEAEGVFTLEGNEQLDGADHPETDLDVALKLALLIAGIYATGATVVREAPSSKDRVDQVLRRRGVEIIPSRQDDARAMTVAGGQQLAPVATAVAGELRLALPLVVAATSIKGSQVAVRNVDMRSAARPFVDLIKQIGGALEVTDTDEGSSDLSVQYARLKATRVADKRAERLLGHVALLAVLATQTEGEFIIRDVAPLRDGDFDYVGHLVAMLRQIDAKVGEYPEGIVVEGGHPLSGGEVDCRDDPDLVMAFTAAGLVAGGEIELNNADCLQEVYPGFFEALTSLQRKTKRG